MFYRWAAATKKLGGVSQKEGGDYHDETPTQSDHHIKSWDGDDLDFECGVVEKKSHLEAGCDKNASFPGARKKL